MITPLDGIADDSRFDVIVIGAGAAGMAAALFAAIEGAKVLLVERTDHVGGTSALSAASAWVPNTHHAKELPGEDSLDKARRFLDGTVGNHSSATLREAFLRSGPEAIATLEANSEMKFRPYALHPDYEQQVEGATLRGRALEPVPFDGRKLGKALAHLRPPIPEFTIFGGMMVDRTDIGHLLNAGRSAKSFVHAAHILGRYGLDKLAGRRGTRLVMGNALTGRFLFSLEQRGVPIVLNTETTSFITEASSVRGVVLQSGQTERKLRAGAVVLAAGGFGRHPTRRAELFHQPTPLHSPAAPGHTGAMQDLALALGARLGTGNADNAFWTPVSVRKRRDGTTAVFPHFVLDRAKPGTVCVNQNGERFTNEADSYHLFGRAMFEANKTTPTIPCFIIADAMALRKYGLGMVRMRTRNIASYLADGYLVEGDTIAALAARLNIPPANLERTIARMNEFARTGADPDFGRGTTDYHRAHGDAAHGPNPTLGPISTAPFYAVRLYPADIGGATGLVIDEWARVLKADDTPIGGLYACGNDANSIMGGTYPGPGITIGPAIVLAYRAIRSALGKTHDHS
ncbi:MAG: FAD-dependent oxidoreductase [Bradyrhizobium sp.]|uniref:FAD-dependent oxidoreductase n=1 Tax=Bradyrhizobium sp. TaxID=376 RepID=UPI001DC8B0D8|nr:FAD-dependent oxidoreductase [Bradyrhizobium sp.]MBV9565144.1 FAD-dependent oxidoreductase [Bradyrhizobium sp.]